jgi:hypothetical protein
MLGISTESFQGEYLPAESALAGTAKLVKDLAVNVKVQTPKAISNKQIKGNST